MDRTPATKHVIEELARIPHRIYQRVSDHMNAVVGGGIVIGNRPLLDMPGTDQLRGHTPYGRKSGTSWNTVQGVYMGGPRRIVINSGAIPVARTSYGTSSAMPRTPPTEPAAVG